MRATPGLLAEVVGHVDYHREITVDPMPVRADGIDWYALRGGDLPVGFVADEDIRRWIPGEPLAGVGDDEPWIDVRARRADPDPAPRRGATVRDADLERRRR